jgi:hypothetical protein
LSQTKNKPDATTASFTIHRELKKALKCNAASNETTQHAELHKALCRGLGRPDLADQVPAHVRKGRASE